MNRKKIKEYLLSILKAFADGKVIQGKDALNDWHDIDEIYLGDETLRKLQMEYRIKPEPKYRPFKTQEECWEEMHRHSDFGWVIELNTQEYLHIGRLGENEINKRFCITFSCDEGHNTPFDKMLSDYTFTDGTPFGIKEE